MKNRFYLKTRESKSERFSPYHAYEVYRGYDGTWYVDDDNGCTHGEKLMSKLEEYVNITEDTEAKIIALAPDVFFFKYTGHTNETFTKDKIYVLRLNKIDFSAENPYRNCIEGVEVPLNCEDPEVKIKTAYIKRCMERNSVSRAVHGVFDCVLQYRYDAEVETYTEWYKQENEWKIRTAKNIRRLS